MSLKLPVPTNLVQFRAIGNYVGGSLAMVGFGIGIYWALTKLAQSRIERSFWNCGPQSEAEFQKKLEKVLDFKRVGKTAFTHVAVETLTITTLEPEHGRRSASPCCRSSS